MLSPHFGLHEFTKASVGRKKFQVKLSSVGYYLAERLALDILEPVRVNEGRPVRVTSGARSWAVYDAMVKDREGTNKSKPSKRSDHFYANHVHPYGVGAADITFHGIDPLHLIAWIMAEGIPVGQAIAYPSNRFVHLSNPRTVLFALEAIEVLPPKARFLVWTPDLGYRNLA
jgi:uncharacterized protein YcbK (DUF882 family)